ncbi:MAG TPA: isopentenyl-diphosphate Delta-isomerase [Gammaproteobacteria bacterium]
MTSGSPRYENVSSESEKLILVDEHDNEIGSISKADAHDAKGTLHRAFSLFIFNDKGELLLQQRSPEKRLWGGYWSNSCCSHPRAGETMEVAVQRRLEQELGMTADLEFVYKFSYQADFGVSGAEHELCWVYVGRATGNVQANTSEISDWRWISPAALDAEMAANPKRFTPWFKLEWERLKSDFAQRLPRGPVSQS